ncbi:MAG: plastocyanin/azurin family copper-binding protein [Gemmatimonadales bacterium]
MTGSGTTFLYEPAEFTVEEGTGITVRFINVSGGPHNVAFFGDSIPAGAADKLNAAMMNRMDNLSGPFLINPNDHYDVMFDGLPEGIYKGYCTPHLALGMKFTLKLQ